jgi:hypothetical protein
MFFSNNDLIENKAGRLSLTQKTKLKKDALLIASAVIIVALLLGTLIAIVVPKGGYVGLVGTTILSFIATVYYKKAQKAIVGGKAFVVCGAIKFDYRSRMSYVQVQNELFVFSEPQKYFTEGRTYCIYYSSNKSILSFEVN